MPLIAQGSTEALPTAQVLQDQLREITRQLDHNQQVRAKLVARVATADPSAQAALQGQIAAIDMNTAELQGRYSEIVGTTAQIEAQKHLTTTTTTPPTNVPPQANPYGPIDPDAISVVLIILAIGITAPISTAMTRWLRRRPEAAPPPRDTETILNARLDRLEQAVDTIAIEIERISEGQRFVTRALTERPASVRPAAGDAPDSAPLGEETPFLALGAGPMEPVPIPQRQAVKQSITPH